MPDFNAVGSASDPTPLVLQSSALPPHDSALDIALIAKLPPQQITEFAQHELPKLPADKRVDFLQTAARSLPPPQLLALSDGLTDAAAHGEFVNAIQSFTPSANREAFQQLYVQAHTPKPMTDQQQLAAFEHDPHAASQATLQDYAQRYAEPKARQWNGAEKIREEVARSMNLPVNTDATIVDDVADKLMALAGSKYIHVTPIPVVVGIPGEQGGVVVTPVFKFQNAQGETRLLDTHLRNYPFQSTGESPDPMTAFRAENEFPRQGVRMATLHHGEYATDAKSGDIKTFVGDARTESKFEQVQRMAGPAVAPVAIAAGLVLAVGSRGVLAQPGEALAKGGAAMMAAKGTVLAAGAYGTSVAASHIQDKASHGVEMNPVRNPAVAADYAHLAVAAGGTGALGHAMLGGQVPKSLGQVIDLGAKTMLSADGTNLALNWKDLSPEQRQEGLLSTGLAIGSTAVHGAMTPRPPMAMAPGATKVNALPQGAVVIGAAEEAALNARKDVINLTPDGRAPRVGGLNAAASGLREVSTGRIVDAVGESVGDGLTAGKGAAPLLLRPSNPAAQPTPSRQTMTAADWRQVHAEQRDRHAHLDHLTGLNAENDGMRMTRAARDRFDMLNGVHPMDKNKAAIFEDAHFPYEFVEKDIIEKQGLPNNLILGYQGLPPTAVINHNGTVQGSEQGANHLNAARNTVEFQTGQKAHLARIERIAMKAAGMPRQIMIVGTEPELKFVDGKIGATTHQISLTNFHLTSEQAADKGMQQATYLGKATTWWKPAAHPTDRLSLIEQEPKLLNRQQLRPHDLPEGFTVSDIREVDPSDVAFSQVSLRGKIFGADMGQAWAASHHSERPVTATFEDMEFHSELKAGETAVVYTKVEPLSKPGKASDRMNVHYREYGVDVASGQMRLVSTGRALWVGTSLETLRPSPLTNLPGQSAASTPVQLK